MNQGTPTAKIHCPTCAKPLLSQVALAEGTRFVVKCPYCGDFTKIIVSFNYIQKKIVENLHEIKIVETEVELSTAPSLTPK